MNIKKKEDDECCEEPCIIINQGNYVCNNCGMVGSKAFSKKQRRIFPKDIKKIKQTEPVRRDFGSRTMINTETRDAKGYSLSTKKKNTISRLSRIQKSITSPIERNFWQAKPKLRLLVSKLNIPRYINDMAWRFYKEVAKRKLTMGRTIDGFLAASLYCAVRINELPLILEDISDTSLVSRKKIIKSLGIIIQKILPLFNLKYKSIQPTLLISKFGEELEISTKTQLKALNLYQTSLKRNLSTNGKDPRGYAAAVLYIASKKTKNRKTQSEITEIAKISNVTLRTRVEDIKISLNLVSS